MLNGTAARFNPTAAPIAATHRPLNVPSHNAMAARGGGDLGSFSPRASTSSRLEQPNGVQWGENFWITIIDPQTHAQFYACPSTGEASWDPPEGNFVMPPSDAGEWWELLDEAHQIPYYYHTKSGETQWTRPEGFVIPLGIIQTTTALGRRFSQNARKSVIESSESPEKRIGYRRSRSQTQASKAPEDTTNGPRRAHPPLPDDRRRSISASATSNPQLSRSYGPSNNNGLYTIPSEPSTSDKSVDKIQDDRPKGPSHRSSSATIPQAKSANSHGSPARSHPMMELHSQSLQGAAEMLAAQQRKDRPRSSSTSSSPSGSPTSSKGRKFTFSKMLGSGLASGGPPISAPPPSPGGRTRLRQMNSTEDTKKADGDPFEEATISQKRSKTGIAKHAKANTPNVEIGAPVLDRALTNRMNPTVNGGKKPVFINSSANVRRLSTGDHRTLPRELAKEIEQFVASDFAKLYFSTHRTGLIFRRRIPVEQMMVWQKAPLASPLLVLNRTLHKDAVKIFKVIQRVMGDREGNRPVGVHLDGPMGTGGDPSHRTITGVASSALSLLEEERWMLSQGVQHGELRDEIFCQTVKQLTENPNAQSVFRGWQLLCVLLVTFPPSKNLEAYLSSFMHDKLSQKEERIDVMAKYCIGRLTAIAKKGPRGKPPTCQEIETASDAAFNPSTFGEPLESIFRLQQRTYSDAKVPIILPFLADGIIALGGLATEGTWRISGDADAVSDLRVRIDKGYYNLEGIDDCHVPASLLKLWLRELTEPLIPERMYNECLASASDPEKVINIVKQLPTINRRVLLFVISLLQLFLQEHIQSVTKMNSVNLALVMAPNLLRCNSDLISTVFTNTQHEHTFVHNLLLHLKPHRIDPDYIPVHGLGSGSALGPPPRQSQRSDNAADADKVSLRRHQKV